MIKNEVYIFFLFIQTYVGRIDWKTNSSMCLITGTALQEILIKNPKWPSNPNFPRHYLPLSKEVNSDGKFGLDGNFGLS
jgi:hypothetical protein